jgi:ABC-2 type transport system permease protein
MRPYRALFRTSARNLLAQQLNFALGLFAVLFQLLAMLSIWAVLLRAGRSVGGFSWPEMKAYLLIAYATGALVSSFTDFRLLARIRDGMVAVDLTKPVDFQRARFAEAAGAGSVEFASSVLVCAGVVLFTGAVAAPVSAVQMALFAVSFALVLPVKFGVVYLVATACFYTQNAFGLSLARTAVTNLFSGALVPLTFLPGWLQAVAAVLPFTHITFHPRPGLPRPGRRARRGAADRGTGRVGGRPLAAGAAGLEPGVASAHGARGVVMSPTIGGRRLARLYRRSLGAHLRAALEYESDFWLLVVAAILTQVVGLVFLGAVFSRVPDINGWRFADVVLIFSMVVVAEGVGSLFFEGTWRLALRINQGELDYMIVRPYPVILQVMSCDLGFNGVGNLVTGGAMFGWAVTRVDVDWSPLLVLGGLVLLASAVLIRVAINLASNATAFWLVGPFSLFAFAMHQVGELAKYPLTVYASGVRAALTFVVPFGFVSFFPASAVLGHGSVSWAGWLTPLVAAYCLGVAVLVFHRGLRRYESAGS